MITSGHSLEQHLHSCALVWLLRNSHTKVLSSDTETEEVGPLYTESLRHFLVDLWESSAHFRETDWL